MTRDISPFRIGQVVNGLVAKILPYGLFVQVEDGAQGYISRRDLSWAGDQDPRRLMKVGQAVTAVVTKLPTNNQSLRLSLKANTPDPWNEFVETHWTKEMVRGVIKNLEPYGAFVEIVPGVDGLVTLEHLAEQPVDKPEDIVWVGDHVESIITHINHKERHVRLSMRQRIHQLNEATEIWQHIQPEILEPSASPAPDPIPTFTPTLGPIFVLDDEEGICTSLVQRLGHLGYEADGATDLTAAREKLHQRRYAVLIVDVQIDHDDGLHFVAEMAEQLPTTTVTVMSGLDTLVERASEIESLGAVAVFPKPLDSEEIVTVLRQIEAGESQPWQTNTQDSTAEAAPFAPLAANIPDTGSLNERVEHVLASLVETTQADTSIIFHLDPISRTAAVVAKIGEQSLNIGALYGLYISPVRDVIQESQPILENYADTKGKKRFDKLLTLLSFSSCIGVPIPTQADPNYALFLFHHDSGAFHRYRVRDALAIAALLATIIEQDKFARRMEQLNALLLNGQVAAGLQHEVNNKLSSIDLRLGNLTDNCETLSQSVPILIESPDYQKMQQTLAKVVKTVKGLRETVGLFQQLMQLDGRDSADVTLALGRAKTLVNPLARRHHITIVIDDVNDLPPVVGNTTALHQALLNLLLNAIQHIPATRPQNGMIKVEIAETRIAQQPFMQIRVADNGPGIHKKLWEQVFTLGYTTRSDGSGQGLYIARSLIEYSGGRLYIADSLIHVGTTFFIELPILKTEEQ